jgi:hypothetical protein
MTTTLPNWNEIDEARRSLASPRLAVNMSVRDEVKFVEYNFDDRKRFPRPLKQVELIHLTDLQYGHEAFQEKRFLAYRDWMLDSPNRFAILGGDMIDAATIFSKGSPYENIAAPIDQASGLVALLKPLADKGRILGYVGGNHERRTIATYGDIGRDIAGRLQVPYSRGVQLIDIYYGEHKPFKVSVWHGTGGARTKGGRAQMLHRFMGMADSQLYWVGHVHDCLVLWDWRQQRKGKTIKLQKIAGCISSSFLDYWGTYAETAGLAPSDTMMARAVLEPTGGKWELTLK